MRRLTLALVGILALVGCGAQPTATTTTPVQRVTVFAAASLQEVFPDIAQKFSQAHPSYTVEFSFGGSSDLATQINNGAEVDVFASANEKQMEVVIDAGNADPARIFATNTLTLVTPANNPAGIATLADVTAEGVKLVVCAEQVPCGAATTQLAEATGLVFTPVSEEQKVTDVLAKVTSGEADAGLVYVTDAVRAGDEVQVIATPEAASIVNRYPIATTATARPGAQEFADFVLGPEGQALLAAAGFGPAQ